MQNENVKFNIDLKTTSAVTSPEGGHVFTEGVILRKVSKFLLGAAEDGVIPIPCYYDVQTGKILTEMLPPEIREEYAEINRKNTIIKG